MEVKYPIHCRFVHYYELGDGFYVDVILTQDNNGEDVFDFWLYHKNYGIKEHQFGVMFELKRDTVDNYLDEIVEVGIPSYKECYAHELLD